MTDFLLKKEENKKKIEKIVLPLEGFRMKLHLKKHKKLLEIKEMVIVEQNMKKNLIIKQFNRTFRKLVAIMIDIIESEDTTSSDCKIALDEISKTKNMLIKKAEKELEKKELNKLKKKLTIVEENINKKLLEIRTYEMLQEMTYQKEYQEEKGRGR